MKLAIDVGYGHIKVFDGKNLYKFPTKISIYNKNDINYGKLKIFEFEGNKYIVGEEASTDGFTILEGNILKKFMPLLIEYVIDKLQKEVDEISTGLALVDWDMKNEVIERIKRINKKEVNIIPQGMGIYFNLLKNKNDFNFDFDLKDSNVVIIDIGFNTINFLSIKQNRFDRLNSKTYPGHGVSKIVLDLKNYLEKTFKIPYDIQEANHFLLKENFKFQGKKIDEINDFIKNLKRNFVSTLFNTILVEDKKTLSKADLVLISGGGSYMLKNVKFPPNTFIDKEPMEFSNVKGYYYFKG